MSRHLTSGIVMKERYRIERLIGQGGMGAVYLATDTTFGSFVAIKQRTTDVNEVETSHKTVTLEHAFEREAMILHHLRHDALPRVTDFFSDSNGQYLVMDYISGNDLGELLEHRLAEQHTPFPFEQVLDWADQVLDVLDYLHSHNPPVIHRDIKPSNIKLTPEGKIILLDLGLAKVQSNNQSVVSNNRSLFAYTLAFAPLEQIKGTGTGVQSDLFSLAMTLYMLLTGFTPTDLQPPCDAVSRASALLFDGKDPLPTPVGVPDAINALLMQTLALNPKDRPPSAKVLRDALLNARSTQQSPMSSPASGYSKTVIRPSPLELPISTPPHPPISHPLVSQTPSVQSLPMKSCGNAIKGTIGTALLCVAVASDGQTIAMGGVDSAIRLVRMRDGKVLHILRKHRDSVRSVCYSTGSQFLVSGSADKSVLVWRVNDGMLLHTLQSHTNEVCGVACSPDGKTVASASWDKTVLLWNIEKGTLLRNIGMHSGDIFSVAFSPDGNMLAIGEHDNTLQLVRVSDGTLLHRLKGHKNWISGVTFSPDGYLLATASGDKTIRLWRVNDGALLYVLEGHDRWVRRVAFSPDGQTLASASTDHVIHLWKVTSGTLFRTLRGHTDVVTDVSFAPDGSVLVSGSSDQTFRVWKIGLSRDNWHAKVDIWCL